MSVKAERSSTLAETEVLAKGRWMPLSEAIKETSQPLAESFMKVLRLLAERKEALGISLIGKDTGVGRQYAYNLVKDLERKGLIVRIGERNVVVGLTRQGAKVLGLKE